MLIEFSVTNFLSFSKKQTLSMVSDKAKELKETNTFQIDDKKKLPRLLLAAGIYGANAAGKSNLLRAIKAMRNIVLTSAKESNAGEPIQDIIPHALSQNEPTEFEIIFIINEIRYQYGFAATQQHITEEWLFAFPVGRSQRWLNRVYQEGQYHWLINATQLKGEKELWKKTTRDNALFLSTAAQLNSEQFSVIFEWFQQNFDEFSSTKTLELCDKAEGKKKILQFMNTADISVNNIELIRKPLFVSVDFPQVVEIKFVHQTSKGKSFQLPLGLESQGTRQLFEMAGAWLNVLEQGRVICIDELEKSLHPLIVRFLVSLFHNPAANLQHSQLIFTTHDTTILDNEWLRRDQIWFVEKDDEQATILYPLSDFSPRKDELLQKFYLRGRYGALPYIAFPGWLE